MHQRETKNTKVKILRFTVLDSAAVTFLCDGCVHFQNGVLTSMNFLLRYVSF